MLLTPLRGSEIPRWVWNALASPAEFRQNSLEYPIRGAYAIGYPLSQTNEPIRLCGVPVVKIGSISPNPPGFHVSFGGNYTLNAAKNSAVSAYAACFYGWGRLYIHICQHHRVID